MSLTDFTEYTRDAFNIITKKPPFVSKIKPALKCPPITNNLGTVGTAFHYVIDLLVNKWNNNTEPYHLVAEDGINHNTKRRTFINNYYTRRLLFLENSLTIDELLPDCIILAKMESVYRCGKDFPNSVIFDINSNDIKDLQNMINIVDKSIFLSKFRCIPSLGFGQSSNDIGGADADLIIDDTLIDIKTTKNWEFDSDTFRQLIGYWWLDCREYFHSNRYYGIQYLAIYYARYGKLFIFDVKDIMLPINKEWLNKSIDTILKKHPMIINNAGEECNINLLWSLQLIKKERTFGIDNPLYNEPYKNIAMQKELTRNNHLTTLINPIAYEILDFELSAYKELLGEING